jgi:hypothetical protein
MLRWLLVVLLGLNALLWAWSQGWLGGNPGSAQREPERLAAQVAAERWQALSPEEARRALRHVPVCREVGPWPDAAPLPIAREALARLGVPALQAWVLERPGEWVVATREADDAEELGRKKSVLNRAGVEATAERLPSESNRSWVVSRHTQREAAQAALNRLREGKGLRALRLVVAQAPGREWVLRSADWPAAQAHAQAPEWPGAPRACAPGFSLAEAPAPAASAASSAASPAR